MTTYSKMNLDTGSNVMTNEQFSQVFEEIMHNLESGPGSHVDMLSRLADEHNIRKEMKEVVDEFFNSLGSTRLVIKYLLFDIEATNREKKQLVERLRKEEL